MKLSVDKKAPIESSKSEQVADKFEVKPQKKNFAAFGRALLKTVAILIPLVLFAYAIPQVIINSSAVLQPFFKAANFTINSSSEAFTTLKKDPTLVKDASGFTNILIVGIDTRSAGGRLMNTDTIILAAYNHKTNQVSMISFPRDLNVNYPNSPSYGKINATYAYGEMRKSGAGMEYLKQLMENITGVKVHYHVMVDLKGFTTIIDQLGGVDVYVDTAFTGDYPTEKFGWTTVRFKKGNDHMNGTRALQYARIRHAYPGTEASDFARARRQQKVIQAVIEKSTKVETLQNTKKIFEIMGTVANNIKINRITPEDIEAGLLILKDKGKPATFSQVLDPSAGGSYGRLIKRGAGYLYTIEPSAGRSNWTAVKNFVQQYFKEPTLVTMTQNLYVYNNGAKDYANIYKGIYNKFYYSNIYNGGSQKGLPAAGVYNIGGPAYTVACQYLAAMYKIPYVDATDKSVSVPRPKSTAIVMVFR